MIYNKIGRREQYLAERDYSNGLVYFGNENDLFNLRTSFDENNEERKIHQALTKALMDLKVVDPVGHKLIDEFYFDEVIHNYSEMGRKYGISRQAYTKRLKKHLAILKSFVIYHIQNDV